MSHILFFCTTRYFLGFVTFIFGAAVCYQETSTYKPQNDKKSSNMLILTFLHVNFVTFFTFYTMAQILKLDKRRAIAEKGIPA